MQIDTTHSDKLAELNAALSAAGLNLDKCRDGWMHPEREIEIGVKPIGHQFHVVNDETNALREFSSAAEAVTYFQEAIR